MKRKRDWSSNELQKLYYMTGTRTTTSAMAARQHASFAHAASHNFVRPLMEAV